ncbi:MAG: DUF4912 domain-containing protein [Candidatus Krumholzibacteria bacterium]|nr:DUF4912 domain-containing protein [Candidatus Krumholzibacteria bacterium]
MKRSELQKMTKSGLLDLARKNKIRVSAGMLKADIIEEMLAGKKGAEGASSGAVGKAKAAAKAAISGLPARGPAKAKRKAARKRPAKAAPKAKSAASAMAAPKAASKSAPPRAASAPKAAPAPKSAPPKAAAKPKALRPKPAPKKRPAAVKPPATDRGKAVEPRGWADERTISQMAVEGKYELTAGPVTMPPVESMQIPEAYDATRIVALTRDPHWIFVYWEIAAERFRDLERSIGDRWTQCTMALRVFDRREGGGHFDIPISYDARNWYINVASGGRWQVAIGVVTPGGRFIVIAESAIIETPRGTISDVVDDRWMIPDDLFDRIFSASGGYEVPAGGSAEMRAALEQRLVEQLGSETVSSFGSGPVQERPKKARSFRLRVATELILYGATEPDALVTVQGKQVKLRGDGTFTMRFGLPDGTIDLPVVAVSSDGVEERAIETDVRKRSREKAPVIK